MAPPDALRCLREWLTAQAVASAEFALAEGTYEVLVDETSPAYLGGLTEVVAAAGRVLPLLPDAYRTGTGVPYAACGPDGLARRL